MKWKAKGNFCHTKVQDVRAVSRSNYDACKAKRQPCVKGQGWIMERMNNHFRRTGREFNWYRVRDSVMNGCALYLPGRLLIFECCWVDKYVQYCKVG